MSAADFWGWVIIIIILSPFIMVIVSVCSAIFLAGAMTMVGLFAKIVGK